MMGWWGTGAGLGGGGGEGGFGGTIGMALTCNKKKQLKCRIYSNDSALNHTVICNA